MLTAFSKRVVRNGRLARPPNTWGPPLLCWPAVLCQSPLAMAPSTAADTPDDDDDDIRPRDKRSWTTVPQWAWLSRRQPAFRASQRAGERANFLAGLYLEWFLLWPEIRALYGHDDKSKLTKEEEEALGEAIAKRRVVRRIHLETVTGLLTFPL